MESSIHWLTHSLILGVAAGVLSCLIFLVFHQLTISNIWFSTPFMLLVSAIAGYTLVKSYFELYNKYSLLTWIGYNSYYIISLAALSLLSVLIFTPKYTSEEILDVGGAPPDGLIISALPLTIIWMIVTAVLVTYVVARSFDHVLVLLATSVVLFLSLGLNISILGFVEVSPQHQYLVEKFMAMNAMLGVSFLVSFALLRNIVPQKLQ